MSKRNNHKPRQGGSPSTAPERHPTWPELVARGETNRGIFGRGPGIRVRDLVADGPLPFVRPKDGEIVTASPRAISFQPYFAVVHPGERLLYRVDRAISEGVPGSRFYTATAMIDILGRPSLWAIGSVEGEPPEDYSALEPILRAAAGMRWLRVTRRPGDCPGWTPLMVEPPLPDWSGIDVAALLDAAFGDRVIADLDHPLVQLLRQQASAPKHQLGDNR